MSLSLYRAQHITLSHSGHRSSGGLAVAIGGIALAVVVMIISMSVMEGFRREIRNKIMGFDAQLTIVPTASGDDGNMWLKMDCLGGMIDSLPAGVTAELAMRQPAIMKSSGDFTGVVVKGIDPGHNWDFIKQNLVAGAVPDFAADSTEFHIILSRLACRDLGVTLGDRIDTYFLGSSSYRARRLKVVGIYDTHFSDYDRQVVYASLPMLRRVTGAPDSTSLLIEITGIETDEMIDALAEQISDTLRLRLLAHPSAPPLRVANIHDSAALYFNWLSLLDTNVTVLLALMALLSSLTLVSSLFILVLRRVNMIGVLKALGASNRLVRRTFILMTMRILIYGLLVGNLLAIALISLQQYTAILPLDPEAYYLDHVPVALNWYAIALLNAAVILLSAVILILPSAIVSTIPPSRAINYE
ncbi:MAG: ABC transporter permease [Duncaniella sp.]|nr:ABC transporter permease [Duncaniella sp.]